MRIVFFGTSAFAVPVLEALVSAGMRLALVVTTPDAPVGRRQALSPPPVKVKAMELGLPVFQPTTLKDQEVHKRIAEVQPDVGVLAAYGRIVPKAVLDIFPKGILNVHPSLLPRWRGATPIQAAILAGDEKTGVTIILMDEEVDHGPILAQRELEMSNWALETYETLHEKLAKLAAAMVVEVVPQWLSGTLSPIPQDHAKATYCRKFTREDAKIVWSKSAEEIERMIRALNPEPGTWTIFGEPPKVLKILSGKVFSNSQEFENKSAGEIFEVDRAPVVRCGSGALILERVQPEGKQPMSGEAFIRGHRALIGQRLG